MRVAAKIWCAVLVVLSCSFVRIEGIGLRMQRKSPTVVSRRKGKDDKSVRFVFIFTRVSICFFYTNAARVVSEQEVMKANTRDDENQFF